MSDVIANWTKLGHSRPAIQNDKTGKFVEVTLLDEAPLHIIAEQVNEVTEQVTEQVSRLLNCLLGGPLGTRALNNLSAALRELRSYRLSTVQREIICTTPA